MVEPRGGLCYLAGQLVDERDVMGEVPQPFAPRQPLEEALTALRKGALLLKHGRHGRPKVHFFRVTACDTLLRWRSAAGTLKQVKLRLVTEVLAGQTTEVFRRHPLRDPQAHCFSLLYTDEQGASRTLDLTCADSQQYELWCDGLRMLAHRLRSLGMPVTAVAVSAAGTSAAADRIPGDLLAWGSAQRAPPVPTSLRSAASGQRDFWQHRSMPGLAPGGVCLDVHRAAVGRRHAAVITATGALYTWGEGRGGKLGLGHDQDQPQPHRVRHGLEGQCMAAVACGDDCSAAVTVGGELYMWGRLHADSRPQLVPLQLRGDLCGQRVVQVSCGPFHCAAVSAAGQLFTWGEGFGGKLGHGDQSNRRQPALLQALVGQQVLEAACGVWHTAAIVQEPEGSPPEQQLQRSPLKVEGPAALASAVLPPSPVEAAAHRRNHSTSSAFSEVSAVHQGQGGSLYTWGGMNESVVFGSSEKHDSNKGCLGHGEADLYRGQLLPTRVGGALDIPQVRHVAAGSHLTIAVTTSGRVFQMGATGVPGPSKHCSWEGATLPELVRGKLQGYFIEEVSCGMHHVVALGRLLDRQLGRPGGHAACATFAWGRGSEGQLGVKSFEDSSTPMLIDALKGRAVLQVTCSGSNSMAVCEHNVHRWEPDSKEEAEAACRALYALAAEPKVPAGAVQPMDVQGTGEPARGGMSLVRRSFSMMTRSSHKEAVTQPGSDLARISSSSSVHSLGGASGAGSGGGPASSFSLYARRHSQHGQQQQAAKYVQQLRTDRSRSETGSGYQPLVSISSPTKSAADNSQHISAAQDRGRRSTYAGGGMPSTRSFTLSGGAAHSDISSLSSWRHRPRSDEGGSVGPAQALDDVQSGGSAAALLEELAQKDRTIDQLQGKLEKMQWQLEKMQRQQATSRTDNSLREAVLVSAGAFRQQQRTTVAQQQQTTSRGSVDSTPSTVGVRMAAPQASWISDPLLASGECIEELEPGVLLTFSAEGTTKKLRRIRFSRSVFTTDSAKQWYDANKHRLAQPSSLPSGDGMTTPADEEGKLLRSHSGRNFSFDTRDLVAFHERLQP